MATDEDLKEAAPLILAGHLNMALCYLKLGKFIEGISSCDKVTYDEPVIIYRSGFMVVGVWGGGGGGGGGGCGTKIKMNCYCCRRERA